MDWNYNTDDMPKGGFENRTVTVGGEEKKRSVFIPVPIIIATMCGDVIKSRWLPDSKRWEFLGSGQVPECWQPWIKHPRDADLKDL